MSRMSINWTASSSFVPGLRYGRCASACLSTP